MLRLLATGLVTLMTLGMIGGVAAFLVLQHYGSDLPSIEKLKNYEPDTASRLYAGNGRLLVEYATQNRIFVPIEAMPKRVIQAFLSAEDKNFYKHPGVDFLGVVRAVATNVGNMGSDARLVGASTITQQVVKNFLLTNEQSFERKIKEALLAFRISKVLKKDTVLELYLNDIYLGFGSYGVASAALNYFNKSLDELTLEEAAFLAALPKAPANYNPHKHYERAKSRRDWVIERMEEDKYISDEEAEEAIAKPILTREQDATEFAVASFFAEEVRRKLVDMYGSDSLYKGGLTVHTTVNPAMQKLARNALRNALIDYDRRHGYRGVVRTVSMDSWLNQLRDFAELRSVPLIENERLGVVLSMSNASARIGFTNGLDGTLPFSGMKWAKSAASKPDDIVNVGDVVIVAPSDESKENYELRQVPAVNGAMMVMDPHTGRVLAMVGGYSYENTEFNRATQAQRQPGSAFKPFVYLAGLERGFTPSTIILDAPISINQGPGLPMWQPKNYGGDFLGPATLRKGLETSRNVMTVRLALQIGIKGILDVAYRFGIYDKLPPQFSVVLGSQETTLVRLVNAYSMLVNGGKKVEPALIERIQNRKGKTIFRRDVRVCENCVAETASSYVSPVPPIPDDNREQVVDPRVAYQVVSMMEGVVQRGTATRARVLNRPLAGKTGTTNDSRDAWFIGYTPDLVAGVYIGFDNPRTLGKRETGGRVALPAFIDFMQNALKDTPSVPFRIPDGIRLIKLDRNTGYVPGPDTQPKDIILEAFKQNQRPGSAPIMDYSSPAYMEGQMPDQNSALPYEAPADNTPSSPVVGTGGLY
ncbi:MAG: penicillin-binding protein 1A [Alphaproteobacteria bacterium]|nr:penicillin-binding protein 1A [Alphaproteobacteria bacterium]